MRSSSMAPPSTRATTTADASRSAGCSGNTMPRLTAPTRCPARPMRCSAAAVDGGASTWMTRSTSPMSMPSSRVPVATTHRSRPSFNAASMPARSSLLTLPWCARANIAGACPATSLTSPNCAGLRRRAGLSSSGAWSAAHRSFSRPVSFSALRREFTNTSVEVLSDASR